MSWLDCKICWLLQCMELVCHSKSLVYAEWEQGNDQGIMMILTGIRDIFLGPSP